MIALYGFWYIQLQASGDISFLEQAGIANSFRPFYVAGLAFSTIGFTGAVKAQSLLGQVALMSNFVSGYITLGLLLAILANSVARRA